MRISLLGELEVFDSGDAPVAITGTKQRALLAILALHAGRVVPTDALVEALWGAAPPPAVRNGLQGLVSKLRRALGATELVAMRAGGYVLDVTPEAVDAHRFEQLVDAGRSALDDERLADAVTLLTEADGLWRGPALAEFAFDDFANAPAARLTERRLAAIEDRYDAELQLGRSVGAMSELDALVGAHPLRERLRGLLMLALYRAGRQSDALRIYRDGRRLLADELGLDPSPELRRLEAAILAHDPSLDPPAAPDAHRPATPPPGRGAIPAPLTALIGREEECADLLRRCAHDRLVTLVGPGGVGKTRLALEVARARGAATSDGAFLVELAPVGDPAAVRTAISTALALPDPTALAIGIGDREVLIVLDNCEHVIAAAAEVVDELLQRCSRLRVVATSREALRINGETVWPVPPLGLDDARHLFVARATATGAALDLSGDTLEAVTDICARLDGLPLAVELAAARTRAFPVAQLRARLDDRFRLLTGGSRTALPRQQTLRAVVDWSYDLLFADEQRVFERLSVVAGGCDLDAAHVVCADDQLDATDVDDIIQALVDKSLVEVVPNADDVRVTMLQTLAQYGREKLAERGDAARARDAMARHYAALCADSAHAFAGDRQGAWLAAVARERDNLRASLEWAVATGDATTALTIAGGAAWPHWLAGTLVDAKRWLDAAFSCEGRGDDSARALALVGRGLVDFQLGVVADVDADFTTALAEFERRGDVDAQALTYSFYAEVAAARGDVDEARRRRHEVLDFYRALPADDFTRTASAYSEGKLGLLDGDLAVAERAYRAAAAGFGRIDRPMMHAMCLGMVADFDERAGDHRAAIDTLEQAIAITGTLGLRGFMGALLARLGWAHLHVGDTAAAERAYERAIDVVRPIDHAAVMFLAVAGVASLRQLDGRVDDAAHHALEALDELDRAARRRLSNRVDPLADMTTAAASCTAILACSAASDGRAEDAAVLLGRASALHDDVGRDTPPFLLAAVTEARELASAQLGHDAFRAAFSRGRRDRELTSLH